MLSVEFLRTTIFPHLSLAFAFIDADNNLLGRINAPPPLRLLEHVSNDGGIDIRISDSIHIGNPNHWGIAAIDIGFPPLYRAAYKVSGTNIILPRNEVLVRLYGEDVSF